jgi:ribosomal protein S18 acetylase RimI-like enzyme
VKTPFIIERLSAHHDRLSFGCGSEPLDRYLRGQAGQDMRKRISNCFVAVPRDSQAVVGFYTLAAANVPLVDLPPDITRRLPRYANVPTALIGRIVVDLRYAGQSLGSALLYDALTRAAQSDPAVFAMTVDAKNDNAVAFYKRFGFQPFPDRALSLYFPIASTPMP